LRYTYWDTHIGIHILRYTYWDTHIGIHILRYTYAAKTISALYSGVGFLVSNLAFPNAQFEYVRL